MRAAAPLAALWAVAALAVAAAVSRATDWGVMTDELLYAELARGLADSPLPTLRGERVSFLATLYPALLAPLYALLDAPTAFRAGLALNAILITSACVPTYLLARRVLPRPWSLAAAALAVATPWTGLAGFLMSESAAYPVFAWALLALQRAVAAPTPRRDALALAAIVVAFFTRTQFTVLVVVFATAVVLHEALARRGMRAALRCGVALHPLAAAAYAAGALVVGAAAMAGRVDAILGDYSVTVRQGALVPRDSWRWALLHLDQVAIGLGVVPFVLGVAWLAAAARSQSRDERALASVGLVTAAAVSVQAASFSLRFGEAVVRDRYVFYVLPLVAVGTAAWLASARRPAWPPVALAVLGAVTLPWLDFPRREGLPADSPGSVLNNAFRAIGVPPWLLVGALGVALTVVAAAASRRRPGAAMAVLIAFGCASAAYGIGALLDARGGSGRAKSEAPLRRLDWVDARVDESGSVDFAPYPVGATWSSSARTWWATELWNHTLGTSRGSWTYASFPTQPLRLDATTGALVASRYLVRATGDSRFGARGRTLARRGPLELVRLDDPPRARWASRGVEPDGWLVRDGEATLRVYAHAAEAVTLRVRLAAPATGGARFTLGGRRGAILPGDARTISLTLCAAPPFVDVRLTATRGGNVAPPPRAPVVEGAARAVTVRVERVEVRPARQAPPRGGRPGASGTCAA